MTGLLALGTALVLGFLHAIEIDHMVAVTAFISRRPTVPAALAFSLRWGLGHSLSVFAAGAILLATGVSWSPSLAGVLEGAVGVPVHQHCDHGARPRCDFAVEAGDAAD